MVSSPSLSLRTYLFYWLGEETIPKLLTTGISNSRSSLSLHLILSWRIHCCPYRNKHHHLMADSTTWGLSWRKKFSSAVRNSWSSLGRGRLSSVGRARAGNNRPNLTTSCREEPTCTESNTLTWQPGKPQQLHVSVWNYVGGSGASLLPPTYNSLLIHEIGKLWFGGKERSSASHQTKASPISTCQ